MKNYIKNVKQPMTPYMEGFDMTGVSISQADKDNGSPRIGDMIAVNPKNAADRWLVAEQWFKDNFIEVE